MRVDYVKGEYGMSKWWSRALADPPKGGYDNAVKGPEGFWHRLLTDDEDTDKLEDKRPANTFVEIALWLILIFQVLNFIMDLLVNLKELLC